jgi:hypothetical protein
MDAVQEIQKLREMLLKFGYMDAPQTIGCSEETVDALNKYAVSGRLPEIYRQFLFSMGGYLDGRYMGNYLFTCEYLDEIQTEGHAMAKQYNIEVPSDAFFFATFDYVDYFYFRTHEENDSPPVYMCSSRRQPLMMNTTLLRFFLAEMGDKDATDEQP